MEHKFKKGDKVKLEKAISSNAKYCMEQSGYNLKLDTEMEVVELSKIADQNYNILCAWESHSVWFMEKELIFSLPKEKFEVVYDEPEEDEMDDNCVAGCRPGEHKCDKKKTVLIKLIQIGRGKKNSEFVLQQNGRTEEELAEVALKECKKLVISNDVFIEPNESKGKGHYKLRVGMGYHVGDVEIKL